MEDGPLIVDLRRSSDPALGRAHRRCHLVGVSVQRAVEKPQIVVAIDPAERSLALVPPRRSSAAPSCQCAIHVASHLADAGVERVDWVRGLEFLDERGREPEPGVGLLQLIRQHSKHSLGRIGVHPPGGIGLAADERPQRLGQVVEDVAAPIVLMGPVAELVRVGDNDRLLSSCSSCCRSYMMGSKAVEPKLYLSFSLDAAIPAITWCDGWPRVRTRPGGSALHRLNPERCQRGRPPSANRSQRGCEG